MAFSDYGLEPGDVINILGTNYVFYEDEMRTGGSWAWRDNNPGNITHFGNEAERYGAYAGKYNDIFAIFPDEQTGFQAIGAFLKNPSRSGKTIAEMMQLYAPAGHGANDPVAYAQQVAAQLGVPVGTVVADLDDDQIATFSSAIQRIEGWQVGQTCSSDSLPGDLQQWLDARPDRAQQLQDDQPLARRGSQGEGVKNLQRLLNQWLASQGLPVIAVDGDFGGGTDAAVRQFQQAHGLVPPDGIAGPKTWIALAG